MRPWRVGGDGVDGGAGVIVDVVVWGLARCDRVVLRLLSLAVRALLMLWLAVLGLWWSLLILLLGLAIWVHMGLARVGVVLLLLSRLIVVVWVLRIADDACWAGRDRERIRVDGLILSHLCLGV